jgi:ABC-2 type transport system ATP-binding protein
MAEPIFRIDTDDAPQAVPLLTGAEGILDVSLFGRGLRVVMAQAERAEARLREPLARAGLRCRAIERIAPSLEDVFVSCVNRAGGALVG